MCHQLQARHRLHAVCHSRPVTSEKAAKMQGFRYLSIMFRTFPQHAKTARKRAKAVMVAPIIPPPLFPKSQDRPSPTRCSIAGVGCQATLVRRAQPRQSEAATTRVNQSPAPSAPYILRAQIGLWHGDHHELSNAIKTPTWPGPLLGARGGRAFRWAGGGEPCCLIGGRKWVPCSPGVWLFSLSSACFSRAMGSSRPSSTPSRAPAWPPSCGRRWRRPSPRSPGWARPSSGSSSTTASSMSAASTILLLYTVS